MRMFSFFSSSRALLALSLLLPALAWAAPDLGISQKQPLNWHAIGMFFVFVLMTLGITYWAAGRSKSASDFYTAGGGITGKQNGLAIAGDFMSAATLLGLTAMIYGDGVDGYIYMVAFFVGWPIILFLMAERLRNLGKFTFADITAYRLSQGPVRTMAAVSSLTVVCFYLVAQMVGAGQLIKLLFGLDYNVALVVVGVLMMVYVIFGGMVATTWVQIIKACMLLAGGTAIMLLAFAQFGFSLDTLLTKAMEVHRLGTNMLSPGKLLADPVTALSMGLGLMFGIAGLPHILMRFFTVTNAQEARKSVFYASGIIAFFFNVIAIMGLSAIVLVGTNPEFFEGGVVGGKLIGGGNMVALHLAKAAGGNLLLGFLSAVAFATILAVVAGLALAGASAISHDLYARVIMKGKASESSEIRVSKIATLGLGVVAVLLGIMILPTIITVSKTSLDAVPDSYYEGSLALGATHERSVFYAVLPAAKSGVLSAVILGIGRAIGETMAVVMVAGNQTWMPKGLFQGLRTMTSNIVIEMGYAADLHREALIATGVVLFVFILLINLCLSLVKGGKDYA